MLLTCKLSAALLSLCLLGQSTLLSAEPARQESQPKTLAQYQQQLLQDLNKAPWVSEVGTAILVTAGIAAGGLIVQRAYYNNKFNRFYDRYLRIAQKLDDLEQEYKLVDLDRTATRDALSASRIDLNDAHNHLATLERRLENTQAELAAARADKAALEKELKQKNNQVWGWKASANTQRYNLRQAKQHEKELLAAIENLKKELNVLYSQYDDLAYYSPTMVPDLKKYEPLFDRSLPQSERQALREALSKEPWLLKVPAEQQKEFLKIIDKAGEGYASTGDSFFRFLIRQSIDRHVPLYERLIGMCRHVFRSKNLTAVGLLLVLGATAHTDAHAQKMSDRLNTRFIQIFSTATPEELKEMEENEELRNLCIQGAETVHTLSLLPEEEIRDIRQSFSGSSPRQEVFRPRFAH